MISSGSTTEKYDIVNNVAICNVISNCHLLLGRTPVTQLQNPPQDNHFVQKLFPGNDSGSQKLYPGT